LHFDDIFVSSHEKAQKAQIEIVSNRGKSISNFVLFVLFCGLIRFEAL